MKYEKKPYGRRAVKVLDIIFGEDEDDTTIESAISEVFNMDKILPGLMSAQGVIIEMSNDVPVPEYVIAKMQNMSIGENFQFVAMSNISGCKHTYKITRISNHVFSCV